MHKTTKQNKIVKNTYSYNWLPGGLNLRPNIETVNNIRVDPFSFRTSNCHSEVRETSSFPAVQGYFDVAELDVERVVEHVEVALKTATVFLLLDESRRVSVVDQICGGIGELGGGGLFYCLFGYFS